MADLFSNLNSNPPLAERLRPTRLDEVVGQKHLIGHGRPLRIAFDNRRPQSFILWGPPGVGKTTLGRMAAELTNCHYIPLSATSDGVKEIREALERAQLMTARDGRKVMLFIDEVHRLNKGQQDVLLPQVEAGQVILAASTTENPSFALNSALLSRALVYTVKPLDAADLEKLYERAKPHLEGVTLAPAALKFVIGMSDGDGRRFVNYLEQIQVAAKNARVNVVDEELVKDATSDGVRRFDKGRDAYYDTISAFHKSIRGSNPDAAIYWLARMLDGGAEPKSVARRMVAIASEDIGNADPRALQVAVAAWHAYERLGSPEGELNLAHAAVYLAMAPKSNAVYTAWNAAKAFVRQDSSREVPMRLRNAPTELMKDLGYHEGYRYAHNEPDAYAAGENYFPEGMEEPHWYRPVPRGLEIKIGEKLQQLQAADAAARQPASMFAVDATYVAPLTREPEHTFFGPGAAAQDDALSEGEAVLRESSGQSSVASPSAPATRELSEDERFDGISDLIDQHPVGRPMARVSGQAPATTPAPAAVQAAAATTVPAKREKTGTRTDKRGTLRLKERNSGNDSSGG